MIVLSILFCSNFGSAAYAQPTVTLTTEMRGESEAVLFTFTQNNIPSMDGCHYNLLAADEAKDLETLPGRGRSIATFYRAFSPIQILSGPLPRLGSKLGKKTLQPKKHAKVYFRTLLSCPGAISGMSELTSVTMKTSPKGKLRNVDELTRKMKHAMQYYGDSVGR